MVSGKNLLGEGGNKAGHGKLNTDKTETRGLEERIHGARRKNASKIKKQKL